MLGRRLPRGSLVAAAVWPHAVPADSFYGRLVAVGDLLFRDEDLAAMCSPDNGRPGLPPSLLCGVLLLQFSEGVGDEEAVERLRFDLSWKAAPDLPLDCAGFDPSSLVVFRKRVLAHGQERYAFDRFLGVAHQGGFLPAQLRQLVDCSPIHGAGALQGTDTLPRKGIRRLLRAMGVSVPEKRGGLKANLVRYPEQDCHAPIDWADPQARREELTGPLPVVLVRAAATTRAPRGPVARRSRGRSRRFRRSRSRLCRRPDRRAGGPESMGGVARRWILLSSFAEG